MTRLFAIRCFVRVWIRAISVSDKLPTLVWNVAALVSILMVLGSIAGLHLSSTCIQIGGSENHTTQVVIVDPSSGVGVEQYKSRVRALNQILAARDHALGGSAISNSGVLWKFDLANEAHFTIVSRGSSASYPTKLTFLAQSQAPTITNYSWNDTPTANQPFSGTITGTNFVVGGTQLFFCVNGASTCYQSPASGISLNSPTSLTMTNISLGSGSYQIYGHSSGGVSRRFPAFAVQDPFPPSPINDRRLAIDVNLTNAAVPSQQPENRTPIPRDALFWISLFNTITGTLNVVSMSILAWISNRRAKAELILKQAEAAQKEAEARVRIKQMELEIMKLQQEIENARPGSRLVLA